MSQATEITASDVRLARALVQDAAKRSRRESAHIEAIANATPTNAAAVRTAGATPPEIRPARALVHDAAKRGDREDPRIENIAHTAIPGQSTVREAP